VPVVKTHLGHRGEGRTKGDSQRKSGDAEFHPGNCLSTIVSRKNQCFIWGMLAYEAGFR
jgi:hypothetical protein